MIKDNTFKILAVLQIAISLVFALSFFASASFPYFGFSVTLVLLTSYAACLYRPTTSSQKQLLAVILFFALMVCIRSNLLVTFLNIFACIYLLSWYILPYTFYSGLHLLLLPGYALEYILGTQTPKKSPELNQTKLINHVAALVLAGLISYIIVLALVPTNPIFEQFVTTYLKLDQVTIQKLFSTLLLPKLVLGLLTYAFLKRAQLVALSSTPAKTYTAPSIEFLSYAKIATGIILLVYISTQLQLQFASETLLTQFGYSHALRTREIFGVLSFVSLIVLGLLDLTDPTTKFKAQLTKLLIGELILLGLFSLNSVLQYIFAFGFTEKRLWGLVMIFWLGYAGSMYLKDSTIDGYKANLTKNLIKLTCGALVTVNILNFDYIVAHFPKVAPNVDRAYVYTVSKLSYDAFILAQVASTTPNNPNQIVVLGGSDMTTGDKQSFAATVINRKINYLTTKYDKLSEESVLSFNLFEFINYLTIK